MTTRARANIADLLAIRGKAELVGGVLVVMSPTGYRPGRAAARILRSLLRHEETNGGGKAIGDNVGFLAGTLVVWDVDLLGEDVVRAFSARDPAHPNVYRRGDFAEAEPAVPGWRMPVDELFD